jgi:phenylpropionate dioxygenase-like ring-hydroxylating dioxygenase large terminal subunit
MASSSREASLEPASVERRRAYLAGLEPFFHVVASVEELNGVGVDEYGTPRVLARELLGRRIIVARLRTGVVAMDATCPHRGADLGLGWVNDTCDAVVCRYHGFEWGADGTISRIPALEAAGRSLPTGEGWRVATFPTVVRYGLVWVCLAAEPRLPVIDLPEAEDDEFRSLPQPTETWSAMCGRVVEASLDTYHFAFAHRSSIGDPGLPAAPVAHVVPESSAYAIEYDIAQPAAEAVTYDRAAPVDAATVVSRYRFAVQPSVVSMMKKTGDVAFAALLAMHPRDAEETVVYRRIYPHRSWQVDLDAFVRTQAQVFSEDRLVVESQRPWELASDLDAELHALMDRPTVGYRRWLASLGIAFS